MKTIIAITAAAITPVEIHPSIRSGMGVTKVPMTFGLTTSSHLGLQRPLNADLRGDRRG
ncbi:hypothetical protein [Caballeronia arationis]|uniref:hypothetical protein n=1 Tax=Caballeronia arationis TaxID=1777142 RepID=UPI000AD4CA60|nr:hypothetical protein [Caballeronia arationis]